MFSLLIRHKQSRVEEMRRCLKSVYEQTYKNYEIIVSKESQGSDGNGAMQINDYTYELYVPIEHYNLHCNHLKDWVQKGWFVYVDDDDALAGPNVLQDLSNIIVNNYPWKGAYIGRFLRNGRPKPPMSMMRQGIIQKGFVGGGCCVLHHSFKDVADWQGVQAGDYYWLKELQDKGVPMKFIDLILQKTFNNGLHGK